MAAPATTAPGALSGRFLIDGYQTRIAFSLAPTAGFWEKTIKPPALDGGEKIPQTTMRNSALRTFAPRSLYELSDFTSTGAYDPDMYNVFRSLVNQKLGSVTITWPDGSTLDFYGFLQKFEPADLAEGTQPEATITVVVTNFDKANNVEAAPVFTSVSGT